MGKVTAVLVAAGSGKRFGSDKMFAPLCGKPVLAHTLAAFENHPQVDELVVVTRREAKQKIEALIASCHITKCRAVVPGGETRADSAQNGVQAASGEIVLVHDGARPLVDRQTIDRVIEAARKWGAAVPCVAVKDTVKQVKNNTVTATPDRSSLFAVQTPQGFRHDWYEKALKSVSDRAGLTDDASLFEAAGLSVKTVEGNYRNLKITTADDLAAAESYVGGKSAMRIGHGYDVHRLTEGRPLVLGGVTVPYEKGLDGHSDADVLLHAVCDALLGAAGLGDIGKHFPDTDDRYRGIDSRLLLRHVAGLLTENGYHIENIDATLIAQAPKIGPFVPTMVQNIASDCGLDERAVNVKATTEEHLGFTGNGEGMAAHAVCLIAHA